MAFGDIEGIRKTDEPVEEEERRPIRETPLDLSGLLGPREREERAGRRPLQRRLSPAEQGFGERVRQRLTPSIDVVDVVEPEPGPLEERIAVGAFETVQRGLGALGVDTGLRAEQAEPILDGMQRSPTLSLIENIDRFVVRPAGAALSATEQQVIEEISARLQGQVPENKVGEAALAFRNTEGTFDERIDAFTDALDLLPFQQGLSELIVASFLDPLAPGQPFVPLVRAGVQRAEGAVRGFGQFARGAFAGPEDLTSLGGRFAAERNPTVQRIAQLVSDAIPTREAVKAAQTEELGRKASRISEVLADTSDIRQAAQLSRAARGGELPRGQIESLIPKMTDQEIDELLIIARDSPDLLPFEKVRAMELIDPAVTQKSLLLGNLPTVGEIGLLQRAFGDEFAEALLRKVRPRTKLQRLGDLTLEVANFPRTLFASFDLSAPGRQGAIFAISHPNISRQAFHMQLQAMRSERAAQVINRSIIQHPDATLLDRAGVFIADISQTIRGTGAEGVASRLTGREEAYLSTFFQRFSQTPLSKNPLLAPISAIKIAGRGVRASERAYVTYLNKVRADFFYQTLDEWRKAGDALTNAKLRTLGRFINNATGRGNLPGFLEKARPALSAIFFSPGLQASRIGIVRSLFDPTMTVGVRRQIYGDLAKSMSAGMTALGMAKVAGADVELDPRSTDFGRIRVGDTRIDFWGGFQPYARFFAQLTSGERVNQAGDIINIREEDDQTVLDQVGRFGRSKLSPAASFLVDLNEGNTIIGDEVISGSNAANTFVPGAIQDLGDAFLVEGKTGIALGLPAFVGIGVNAYDTTQSLRDAVSAAIPISQDEVDLAPELALEEGQIGVPYAQRPSYIQDLINEDPEIVERFEEFEARADPVSTRDLQQIVFTQQEEFQTKANDQLMAQVRSGLVGASLREAVQGFNRERFAANRAVFDPFNERISKVPTLLRDQLGLEYWTAPLELGPDGELDFEQRDIIRDEVLRRAKEAKIRQSYVKGIGKETWRGTLSDVPELNTLLTRYHNDMDTLKSYWETGSDPDFAGTLNRDEWVRYLEGSSAERREIVRRSPAIRRAVQNQGEARLNLRKNNDDIDRALVRWYEYLGQTVPGRGLYKSLYVEAA